jgi:DnaJ-class molecular chaperone
MAVYDHKGIQNIPPERRCKNCEGAGWVRYKIGKKQKSHPCLVCGGNGETQR